jgi:ATPase subunit of ABC transporter with duplicated ATPase domains
VIVLDEPSNHLPVAVVARVVERIRNWPDPPAILVISHDPVVLGLADDRHQLRNPRHEELTA